MRKPPRLHQVGLLVVMVGVSGCGGSVVAPEGDGGSGGGATTQATTTRAAAQSAQQSGAITSTSKASSVSSVQTVAAQTATSQVSTSQQSATSGTPTCDTGDCVTCWDCALQPVGACAQPLSACQANVECVAFYNCLFACPQDNPATPVDEFLSCLCTTAGEGQCAPVSGPGTCLGDHGAGFNDYLAVSDCANQQCPNSCGG